VRVPGRGGRDARETDAAERSAVVPVPIQHTGTGTGMNMNMNGLFRRLTVSPGNPGLTLSARSDWRQRCVNES
jgi:hypothetical protein